MYNNKKNEKKRPSLKDIIFAQNFIRRRISFADELGSKVDKILIEGAGRIAKICLQYHIPAKDFLLKANKRMYERIKTVMDELEERIFQLIVDYSLYIADDDVRKEELRDYITDLKKNNMKLRDILDAYLFRYMYDLESLIASLLLEKEEKKEKTLSDASIIAKVKMVQHSIYTTQEVKKAMSAKYISTMSAQYIRLGGVHKDNTGLSTVGVSNSNANNVINMAKNTMNMAWMKNLEMDFKQDDSIEGFYVMRGSSYPCDLCDSMVGFHPITDENLLPQYHAHCACIAVPMRKEV